MHQHDFREDTPVGQRIMQLAQSGSISDFYITPWEPLCYKLNGELHRDESFIYTPAQQLEVVPGCSDYAIVLGPHRFRVNQLVTRGKAPLGDAATPGPDPNSRTGECARSQL